MKRNNTAFMLILVAASVLVIVFAIGIGSVSIPPIEIAEIVLYKLFSKLPANAIDPIRESICWNIRLPRTLLAFVSGAGLALSGAIMQSILRNPLASSYTLGISSGAAVGASLAMVYKLSFFGMLTVPFFGLLSGMLTVVLAVALASRMDRNLGNTTIILTGMAISLFANALISFLMTWSHAESQRILYWQLGSFSLKDWTHPAVLAPVIGVGLLFTLFFAKEMDIMSFGEEQAKSSGVDVLRLKWILLGVGALLTGCVVSITGIIGFVDLFTPHVARKLFGSRHALVLPSSALIGGMFMVLCDLLSRALFAPMELPVGAVTSFVGAPFFIYLYFHNKKRSV